MTQGISRHASRYRSRPRFSASAYEVDRVCAGLAALHVAPAFAVDAYVRARRTHITARRVVVIVRVRARRATRAHARRRRDRARVALAATTSARDDGLERGCIWKRGHGVIARAVDGDDLDGLERGGIRASGHGVIARAPPGAVRGVDRARQRRARSRWRTAVDGRTRCVRRATGIAASRARSTRAWAWIPSARGDARGAVRAWIGDERARARPRERARD